MDESPIANQENNGVLKMPKPRPWTTVDKAAELIGCHPSLVRIWAKGRKLGRSYKEKGARAWKIDPEAVERKVEAGHDAKGRGRKPATV